MHKVWRDTLFTSRYVSSLFVGKTVWQGGLLNCFRWDSFFSLTSKLVLEYPEKYANNIMQVGNNWLYIIQSIESWTHFCRIKYKIPPLKWSTMFLKLKTIKKWPISSHERQEIVSVLLDSASVYDWQPPEGQANWILLTENGTTATD